MPSLPGTRNWPSSAEDATSLFRVNNNAFTTLSGSLSAGALTVNLTSGAPFDADGVVTLTDSLTAPTKTEHIIFTANSGNVLTVPASGRGAFGSTDQSWSGTTYVRMRMMAEMHEVLRDSVIDILTVIGLTNTPLANRFQPLDADLTSIAALTTTSFGRGLLTETDASTTRSTLGLVIGTDVQAFDADLSAIAALAPSNDDIIQRKAGAWTNRTIAQLKTDLNYAAIATSGSASDLSAGTVPLARLSGITTAELSATAGITNGQLAGSIAISKLSITGTPDGTKYLRDDGSWQAIPGGGDALTSNPLSQFAATTSAQLAGVLSDETGFSSGALAVFSKSPTIETPTIASFNNANHDHEDSTGGGQLTTAALMGLGTGIATALGVNVGSAGAPVLFNGAGGTPSSLNLSNATALPVGSITGLGTGVATALAVNVGSAGAFVTFNGALGTPSSGTLTNATGLPIASGVSGLGANVATFLATPSSANLIAAVTDETGTGALVFATSPTLTTPILGTPTSGTLTNCTGLPVASGISGFGTGVASALAVNVGSAGAPVLFNGALGTPTSGVVSTGVTLGGVTMTLGSDADGDIYYRASNVLTRLPKGTAGQVLTMNAGATAPEWAAAGGGGSLTVGTTAIASGTATRLLYETSGNVLGEISGATSDGTNVTFGSGNLIATSAALTTPAITTSAIVTRNSLGVTNATGVELINNTAAAAGAQQVSPDLVWTGQGWKTTATAASQTVNFRAYLLPVQGTTAPTANWVLQSQINGGGYTDRFGVKSDGTFGSLDASAFRSVSIGGQNAMGWYRTTEANPRTGLGTNGFFAGADQGYFFSNTNANASATSDTAIFRQAAAVIRISNSTAGAGSLVLGTSTIGSIGTSGVGVFAQANGTAPGSSPADEYQLYSADWNGAGTAAAHFRNEEGHIIKICSQAVAALTNNVTSGGTNDQITDWTDLTVYATDAAAIRNAIYQLARKLDEVVDAHRANGLFR